MAPVLCCGRLGFRARAQCVVISVEPVGCDREKVLNCIFVQLIFYFIYGMMALSSACKPSEMQ